MQLLFVDESGTPDDAVFALGGIAVDGDRWTELRDLWAAALATHRWPHDERLQREGTEYVRLDRLVDALLLGPSHHSIGLQAADLVVGSARAARGHLGDASRWQSELEPRFARHPDTGEVRGVGRVEWPRDPGRRIDQPGKLFPA
jgi:Protein of unknown function (DUF3800)